MNSFTYVRPDAADTAVSERSALETAQFIAGGTNLLDLMKENVERPTPAHRHQRAYPSPPSPTPRLADFGWGRW